ncbi:MAG: preprotein translocase subunit SecG [bacterium]
MENVLLAIHYVVCVFLVIVILLQAGKGADMGAAFGGSSQTVFGSRGAATFLSKLTTGVAVVFLVTSISLAGIARNRSKSSILKTVTEPTPVSTPAPTPQPAATPKPVATPAAAPASPAPAKHP